MVIHDCKVDFDIGSKKIGDYFICPEVALHNREGYRKLAVDPGEMVLPSL